MEIQGGNLNAYFQVKCLFPSERSQSAKLCTVGFHLYDILENAKYADSKKTNGCWRGRGLE